jgi:hypothetical protein
MTRCTARRKDSSKRACLGSAPFIVRQIASPFARQDQDARIILLSAFHPLLFLVGFLLVGCKSVRIAARALGAINLIIHSLRPPLHFHLLSNFLSFLSHQDPVRFHKTLTRINRSANVNLVSYLLAQV